MLCSIAAVFFVYIVKPALDANTTRKRGSASDDGSVEFLSDRPGPDDSVDAGNDGVEVIAASL